MSWDRPEPFVIDLQVQAGESFGLVGESGSGKTTLTRCILQLERPTAGRIVIEGTEAFPVSDHSAGWNIWTLQWVDHWWCVNLACPCGEECGREELAKESFTMSPGHLDSGEIVPGLHLSLQTAA